MEEPGGLQLVLPLREGEEDGWEVGDGELLAGGYLQLTVDLHVEAVPHHHPSVGGAGVVPGHHNEIFTSLDI